jgi:predicted AlkP superfamily phosphohydrolase/phosphomutase
VIEDLSASTDSRPGSVSPRSYRSRPDGHGIYDILETKPGTHKQYPVTYKSIKARTFLDDLTAAGKNQLLLDVPLTSVAA